MMVTVRSLGLTGITGYEVSVECFLSGGLPGFDVVGLPDAAVKESRERVRAAVKNCGAKFPVSRITVNLAPARVRKEGTVYDLPILLGILAAAEEISPLPQGAAFLGELSLSGALRPVTGVLPMALTAARLGIDTLYVPEANAAEATLARRADRVRCDGRGTAHRPPEGRAGHDAGAPVDTGTSGPAPAGLRRRDGTGECEAGAGDRRRRRPQCAAGGFARRRASPCWPGGCRPSCRT